MRISDWSSDVCSSDLDRCLAVDDGGQMLPADAEMLRSGPDRHAERLDAEVADALSRMRRVVHPDSLLMVVLVVDINECPIRIQSPGHAIIGSHRDGDGILEIAAPTVNEQSRQHPLVRIAGCVTARQDPPYELEVLPIECG